jgi:hypothetical protein
MKEKKVFLTFEDFIKNDPKFSNLDSLGEIDQKKVIEDFITSYITAINPGKKPRISKKKIKMIITSLETSEILGEAFKESPLYSNYIFPIIMLFSKESDDLKKQGWSDYQLLSFMFSFGFTLSNFYETFCEESAGKKERIKKKKENNGEKKDT